MWELRNGSTVESWRSQTNFRYLHYVFELELKIAVEKWEVGFRITAVNSYMWQEEEGEVSRWKQIKARKEQAQVKFLLFFKN